tara:strand:- start:56 stop:961 length:906 start_codon:yes stop_codon:yes gene_type:complete
MREEAGLGDGDGVGKGTIGKQNDQRSKDGDLDKHPNAPKGTAPFLLKAPRPGERWYHGGATLNSASKDITFLSRTESGAKWYADEKGGTVQEVVVSSENPARLRDLLQAAEEVGATAQDIIDNSPNDGTVATDYVYVPKVRAALEAKGFDSVLFSDVLENTEIDALVPLKAGQGGGDGVGKGVDKNTGLPLNADGTVTVYQGTTANGAKGILRDKSIKSTAEPDVYFTTDRAGASEGYGDGTVIAVDVDPRMLLLDDEFPGGRLDFRVNVGDGGSLKLDGKVEVVQQKRKEAGGGSAQPPK